MKILLLTYSTDPKTGWGRLSSDLIHGFRDASLDVVVLKEMNDGCEGLPILHRGISIFTTALKIRRYIKDCDIIHALDVYPYGIIAYLANLFYKKKLVITVLGTYSIAPFYNFRTSILSKIACRSASTIVAISSFTKIELIKKVKVSRIELINPGINLQKFYQEKGQLNNEPYILSVGAIKFRKGYHVSVPAFAMIQKEIPKLKYKIVGSKKDVNYFNKLQGVVGVEFLDNISNEELKKLYREASLFVLTSVNSGHHFEGFGLVFLEAAASGLPVIGTTGNGIEDAIKDGFNGFLVPQNDISATAKAMLEVLKNEDRQKKFSSNSLVWATDHDLSKVVLKYLQVYRAIIYGN